MENTHTHPFRNYYKNKAYLYAYRHRIPDFPFILDIEMSTYCNMKCIFCYRNILKRPALNFREQNFYKIIDEISGFKKFVGIRLCGWGEPLLNPNILDFIKYTKNKNNKLKIYLVTNGILLKKKMCNELVKGGLDIIKVSLQGASADEYQVMRNYKYKLISDNINCLLKNRNDSNSNLFVQVGTSISERDTKKQLQRFYNYWTPKVDEVYHAFTAFNHVKSLERVKKLGVSIKDKKRIKFCNKPFTSLFISSNGKVTFCCDDFNLNYPLGKIPENSLREIWNSKKLKKIQEIFRNGDNFSAFNCCKNCYTLT